MSEQLPGNISGARETYQKEAGIANDYKAGEVSVIDALTSKIREAYGANSDLIGKLDTSTQEYYNAPKQGRELYQNIFNPFQRENLVSQYTSQRALPMLSQANLLGSRMGGAAELANAGVRGFQAESMRQQGKAQNALQNYNNLIQEFQLQEQLNAVSTKELEINGRRYHVTIDRKGDIVDKVDLGPVKQAGSGSGGVDSLMVKLAEQSYGYDMDGDGIIGFGMGAGNQGGTGGNTGSQDDGSRDRSFSYISPEAEQSIVYGENVELGNLLENYRY